jgi:hypothetical protein
LQIGMIGLGPNGLQHGAVPYPRRPIRVAHTCESTLVFRERHQRHRKSIEQPPYSIFDADERQRGQVKSLLQEVDAQHFFKLSGWRPWPLSSSAARSARSTTTTESPRPSRPEIAPFALWAVDLACRWASADRLIPKLPFISLYRYLTVFSGFG